MEEVEKEVDAEEVEWVLLVDGSGAGLVLLMFPFACALGSMLSGRKTCGEWDRGAETADAPAIAAALELLVLALVEAVVEEDNGSERGPCTPSTTLSRLPATIVAEAAEEEPVRGRVDGGSWEEGGILGDMDRIGAADKDDVEEEEEEENEEEEEEIV